MDGIIFRRAPSNSRSTVSRVAVIPVGVVAAFVAATTSERVLSCIEGSFPVHLRRPALCLRVSDPCGRHKVRRGDLICREAVRLRSKAGRKPTAPRGFGASSTIDDEPTGYDEGPKTFGIKVYPNPLLRKRNKVVTDFGPKLRQLAENLFATMYADPEGAGLAAPQVGVNVQMLVFNRLREENGPVVKEGEDVYVNPRVLNVSESKTKMIEECLSAPEIKSEIWRPEWVEFAAVDLDGQGITGRLEDREARMFLHEYDHLQGVLFVDRMSTSEKLHFKDEFERMRGKYRAAGGKNPSIDPRPGALVYTNDGL